MLDRGPERQLERHLHSAQNSVHMSEILAGGLIPLRKAFLMWTRGRVDSICGHCHHVAPLQPER